MKQNLVSRVTALRAGSGREPIRPVKSAWFDQPALRCTQHPFKLPGHRKLSVQLTARLSPRRAPGSSTS